MSKFRVDSKQQQKHNNKSLENKKSKNQLDKITEEEGKELDLLEGEFMKLQIQFETLTNFLKDEQDGDQKQFGLTNPGGFHSGKKKESIALRKKKPKSLSERKLDSQKGLPLNKQKIFVDVYDGPDIKAQKLSSVFEELLSSMGATIMTRLTSTTTIVVWQFGSLKSLERAQTMENIKIVNPCWSDECAKASVIPDYSKYPIIRLTEAQNYKLIQRDVFNSLPQKKVIIEKSLEDVMMMEEQDQRASIYLTPIIIDIRHQLDQIFRNQKFDNYVTLASLQKTNFTQKEKVNKTQAQCQKVIFHKTLYPYQVQEFKDWILEKYHIITKISETVDILIGSDELEGDILVMGQQLKYDFLVCHYYVKNKAIVSYDWCDNFVKTQCSNIGQYEVSLTVSAKKLLWPFFFLLHKSPVQTTDIVGIAVENIIKYYGGRIQQLKFADLCLVLVNLTKKQVQSMLSKNPNIKIVRIQWLYESIQANQIQKFDEYRIN